MPRTDTIEEKKKRSPPRYWTEIKGKLYARLQYKSETGKPAVKYRPITDKRTARSAVEEMRRELEEQGEEAIRSDKLTFAELADRYDKVELTEATYQGGVKVKGRRSVAGVRSAIKPLKAYFGSRHIRSIKPGDIKAYKNLRLETPVEREVWEEVIVPASGENEEKKIKRKTVRTRPRKIATVNRELAWLRSILNFAVENDWLARNPFSKMKGVISASAEAERDRVLGFEEEQRLLDACTGDRSHLKAILICALDTAMRRGEILKMRWADVDFAKGQINIPQTNTKTEEARTVGMTGRLRGELFSLREVSPEEPGDTVFGIGTSVKRAWATACDLAGVKDFRFHDCGHTATTRMIAAGSPHTEVMKITGHSQLKTFLRYLNITNESANRVTANMNDFLRRSSPEESLLSDAFN